MSPRRKKILLIYCGAIGGMKDEDVKYWLSEMPEIFIIVDFDIEIFYSENISNIRPKDWLSLAALIYKKYEQYDGFVVLHGLDNILYTSSALSFFLQNLSKPIIFTGGHLTQVMRRKSFFGSSKEVGVKANLINAIQAATFPIHEVALMFGNKILRANTTRRVSGIGLNFFDSPAHGVLGRIDFSIRLFEKNFLKNNGRLKCFSELEDSICLYTLHPAIKSPETLKLLSSYKGIIFDFGDTEAVSDDIESLILQLSRKTAVAIRIKQNIHFAALKSIINVSRMTSKTALVKFMWALKQVQDRKSLKEIMERNVMGELL